MESINKQNENPYNQMLFIMILPCEVKHASCSSWHWKSGRKAALVKSRSLVQVCYVQHARQSTKHNVFRTVGMNMVSSIIVRCGQHDHKFTIILYWRRQLTAGGQPFSWNFLDRNKMREYHTILHPAWWLSNQIILLCRFGLIETAN